MAMGLLKLEKFVCRVTGRPSMEMEDCGCAECTQHKEQIQVTAYFAEQSEKFTAKMNRLAKRHRRLPISAICYLDRVYFYGCAMRDLRMGIATALRLDPVFITLKGDPELKRAPDVNVGIPEGWARAHFAQQKALPLGASSAEVRQLLDTYVRATVSVARDKFETAWEDLQRKLYGRQEADRPSGADRS
jgi:hypothetical protein